QQSVRRIGQVVMVDPNMVGPPDGNRVFAGASGFPEDQVADDDVLDVGAGLTDDAERSGYSGPGRGALQGRVGAHAHFFLKGAHAGYLHDFGGVALYGGGQLSLIRNGRGRSALSAGGPVLAVAVDRKSTRLNSSH